MFETSFLGYSYHLLAAEQLEILRRWRTDPLLQPYMRYRDPITQEQQINWFASLAEKPKDLHLIAWFGSRPIAYLALKQLTIKPLQYEPSLILGELALQATPFYLTSVVYLVLIQHGLLRVDAVVATVLKNNPRVSRMLQTLGFVHEVEHPEYLLLYNRRDDFMQRCPRLVRALEQISQTPARLEILHDAKHDWVVQNPDYKLFQQVGVDLHVTRLA
jgi:RimJ/RimL family protein N-acetyltransferase